MTSNPEIIVEGNTAYVNYDGVDKAMASWSYDDPGAVRGGSVELRGDKFVYTGPNTGAVYNGSGETRAPRQTPSKPKVVTEARDSAGRKAFGNDITHKHIVRLPNGVETSVAAALHTGDLIQLPDGSYAVAGEAQSTTDKPSTDDVDGESDRSAEVDLGAETDALIVELAHNVQPLEAAALINDACSGREFDQAAIARAASDMGLEPDAFADKANQVRAGYEEAALASVEQYGVDPHDIMAWGYENAPEEMGQAIRRLISGDRRADDFKKIAGGYLANLDKTNPDILLNAELHPDVNIYRADDGQIMVRIKGKGETPYGAAMRAGWLQFSKP